MSQRSVAILIVTYNAEKFISATLQSCLDQTYQHCQIVILDNASTDRTIDRIQQFHDPRIQLHVSQTNLGPYAGLNFLLERISTDYVAIQDHDDIWWPSKIQQQVDWLEQHANYVACGTQAFYFHEAPGLFIRTNTFAFNGYPDHTTLMFRRGNYRYNVARALPDEYFQTVILRRQGKIGCLAEALSIHRIRGDQQNLSSLRSRWNFRGAGEHVLNTRFRDILGALAMLLASVLPPRFIWWSRKHLTYRRAEWLTKEQFVAKYKVQIS